LQEIGWHAFVEQNFALPSELKFIDKYATFPMWRIQQAQMSAYVWNVRSCFQGLFPSKDWAGPDTLLSELLNNVYDHAATPGTSDAYVFVEYHRDHKSVTLVVSDLGVGLVNRITQYQLLAGMPVFSTEDAVRNAFSRGFSTESVPSNRGWGLDNVAEFVRSIDGQLVCYTGQSQIGLNRTIINTVPTTFKLLGTLFQITFNPNLLPEEEFKNTLEDW
jgi:hypothetical protein